MADSLYDETLDAQDEEQQRASSATAPAASTRSKYDEVLDEQDRGAETGLRAATIQGGDTTPDRAASILTLSSQTGIPPEVVDRNYDAIQKNASQHRVPFKLVIDQTPALANYVAQTPQHAALVKDDMENLGALEWILKAPSRAVAQTLNAQGYGALRTKSLFGPLTQEETDLMNSYKVGMQRDGALGVGDNWFKKAITGSIQLGTQLASTAPVYGLMGGATGLVVGAAAGSIEPGGGTVAGGIIGAKAGFAYGNYYGLGKMAFQQEAGQAYDRFIDMKDETGQPLNPEVAKMAALGVGATNAGLMMVGGKIVQKSFSLVGGKLGSLATQSAVEAALRTPTVRAALFNLSKQYGTALTEGTAVMVGMKVVQILGQEVAKQASGQPFQAITPGEARGELLTAAEEGAASFAGVAAVGLGFGFLHDAARAQRAQGTADFFNALGEGAAQSKALGRLPEAVQPFLEDATKDGPIETVYAPLHPNPETGQVGWIEYWQSKGIDPAEMAEKVTGSRDAFDLAQREGSDLAIPTGRYAATLAPTEHNATFGKELRLQPDEMNTLESKAFAEKARAQAAAAGEPAPATPVRAAITSQLEAAGVPTETAGLYANLWESAITNLASRAGVDPQQLFERYGVTVTREGEQPGLKPGEQRLRQDAAREPTLEQPEDELSLLQRNAPRSQEAPLALTDERRQTAGQGPEGQERRRNEPINAMADISRAATQLREEGFNLTPDQVLERKAAREAQKLAQAADVLDPGAPHDSSFNLERFGQRAYDQVAPTEGGTESLTASGPGENPPAEPVPPSATAPVRREAPAPLTYERLQQFAEELQGREPGLTHFSVSLTMQDDIQLGMLAVDRGERRAGIGSRVMEELTRFADLEGKRIILTPGERDETWGTTSRQRLVDFYKRFGFVENKGRNIDFRIREGMYREPTAGVRELFQSAPESGQGKLFDYEKPKPAEPFYSRLTRAILGVKDEVATAGAWQMSVKRFKGGIDFDEYAIASLGDLEAGKRYTRQEVLDYLAANNPRIVTTVLEGKGEIDPIALAEKAEEIYNRMVDEDRDSTDPWDYMDAGERARPEITYDADSEVYHARVLDGYGNEIDDLGEFENEVDAEADAEEGVDKHNDRAEERFWENYDSNISYGDAERKARDELEGSEFDRPGVKYQEYSEPGAIADSYREVFITVPQLRGKRRPTENLEAAAQRVYGKGLGEITNEQHADLIPTRLEWVDGHDEYDFVKNPIVRIRFDRRMGEPDLAAGRAEGKVTVFVQEIQTPHEDEFAKMPELYQKNWRELAFKWILRHAAETGAERVAWTTGEQQVQRYPGIRSVIDTIDWNAPEAKLSPDGVRALPPEATRWVSFHLNAGGQIRFFVDADNRVMRWGADSRADDWVGKPLGAVIGKELADKIQLSPPEAGRLEGQQLEIGGEGLKRLYDADFTITANSLPATRKAGVRVTTEGMRFTPNVPRVTYRWEGPQELTRALVQERLQQALALHDTLLEQHAAEMRASAEANDVIAGTFKSSVDEQLGHNEDLIGQLRYVNRRIADGYQAEYAVAQQPEHVAEALGGRVVEQREALPTVPIQGVDITPKLGAEVLGGQYYFQPPEEPTGARGSIRFGPDRQFNINLLAKADLSTFLHESGHFFLEVFGDLHDQVQQLEAGARTPQQTKLVADYQALLKWMEVGDRGAIDTAAHEKFAGSFEQYLMEGRAPSPELQSTFSRFRAWLVGIYRSLSKLNVDLTPEVTGILDRLVASDRAIADAEAQRGVAPLFLTPEAAGMAPEEFALYRNTVSQASTTARETLDRKLFGQMQREREKDWKTKQAEVIKQTKADVASRPEYRALDAMRNGVVQQDGTRGEPVKLSRALLEERYGADAVRKLPRSMLTTEGGQDPDVVAQAFGFSSGRELLQRVSEAPTFTNQVNQEVQQTMVQRYGNLLLDGTLPEVAKGAAANLDRDAVIRAEMRALLKLQKTVEPFQRLERDKAKQTLADAQAERAYERRWLEAEAKLRIAMAEGAQQTTIDDLTAQLKAMRETARGGPAAIRAGIPSAGTLKQAAIERVNNLTIRNLKPDVFWSTSRRAAQQAVERAARQDIPGTIEAKTQELLHLNYYREAERVQEEIDTALEGFRDLNRADSTLAKTRDMDFVNAARAVLAKVGLGPEPTERAEFHLDKLRRDDPEVYDHLSDMIEATPKAKDYKTLAVADFRTVASTVDSLMQLTMTKTMDINGQRVELAAVRKQVLDQVHTFNTPGEQAGYKQAVGKWDRVKVGLLGLRASARRVEDWVTVVDNGRSGPARKAIYDPINRGVVAYDGGRAEMAQRYADIVKALPPLKRGQIDARELGYTFDNKQELLGALLHVGNGYAPGSNGDKLLRGRNWDRSAWSTFLERMHTSGTLTKADYDYVQAVWDLNGSLKDAAQTVHKARFGRYFDEVTAVPVDTPFGQYPGGYYPAIADPFITPAAGEKQRASTRLEGGAGGSSMFPSVGRGFTQTRVESYAKPLIMDASQVVPHLNAVLRFIHLSQPVSDVARLVLHPGFRGEMDAIDPAAVSDLLVPFLYRAASQRMFNPMEGKAGRAMDTVAREIRNRGAMQIIALNATVLAEQFTHFPSVLVHPDIDGGRLLSSLWQLSRSPKEMAAAIHEASPFMATRESAGLVEAQQQINNVLLEESPLRQGVDWVQNHSRLLMQTIQQGMDNATWQAVYDKVASEPGSSHDEAVARADSAVRQSLGSYRPQDRAAIEGGNQVVGLLNQFYGFFNTKLNMLGTEAVLASRLGLQRRYSRAFAIYAFGFMVPALLGEGIKNAMRGKGVLDEQKNDDTAWALFRFWGDSQLQMGARMIPFGGAAVRVATTAFGKGRETSILNAPAIATVENALRAPGEATRVLTEPRPTRAQKAKATTDIFTLLGLLSNLPMRPVGQVVNTLNDNNPPAKP